VALSYREGQELNNHSV